MPLPLKINDLRAGRAVARRYRNRRIGEFLKELDLTEGRSAGIPKILQTMTTNGSATPSFETDPDRTSFLVRLHVRPAPEDTGPSQATGQVAGQVAGQVEPWMKHVLTRKSHDPVGCFLIFDEISGFKV